MCQRVGQVLGMVFIVVLAVGPPRASAQVPGVDLIVTDAPGWDQSIVPKLTPTATTALCKVDWPLGNPFYWNVTGADIGTLPSPSGFDATFYVDGDVAGIGYSGAVAERYYVVNQGPVSLDLAGRHTLSAYVDALHIVSEYDETNNTNAVQYLFPPVPLLGEDQVLVRPAPPLATGGHSHRAWIGPPFFDSNCDGSTFYNTEDGWQVVVARRLDPGDDLELDMYIDYGGTGPLDFDPMYRLVSSDLGLTHLEGVYLHVSWLDVQSYNLGVDGYGDSDYRIVRRGADPLTVNVPRSVHFDEDQDLDMFKFALPPSEQGIVNIAVRTDDEVTLWVDHLAPDFSTGSINYGHNGRVLTNGHGEAVYSLSVDDDQEHAVVVFRDPFVHPGPVDFEIVIRNDLPNLQPYLPLMTADIIIPANGEHSMGFIPGVLYGDSNTTYWEYCMKNTGAQDAGNFIDRLYVDGASYPAVLHLGGLDSWGEFYYSGSNPTIVRGGRHTVGLLVEAGESITEVLEKDNAYVRQFHWLPAELWYGGSLTRPAPPERNAGWGIADPDQELLPNFDALRLPAVDPTGSTNNWWRGLAVMPVFGCNLEMTLLTPYIGSVTGFGDTLAVSDQGVGLTDFIVVNMHEAADPGATYDVGIALDKGTGSYTASSAGSIRLPQQTSGIHGPFTLGSGELLDLLEVQLDAGLVTLAVDNRSPHGLLGLCLLDAGAGIVTLTGPEGHLARKEATGEGLDIDFTLTVLQAGNYCLAVYRVEDDDPGRIIDYQVLVLPGVSDVPPALPKTVLLEAAAPNPFNPQTTIAFEIPSRQATTLRVFDLSGRMVRILMDGVTYDPGRHEVTWNGRDDAGRQCASGTYIYRLETGEFSEAKRMMLVK